MLFLLYCFIVYNFWVFCYKPIAKIYECKRDLSPEIIKQIL